MKKHRKITINHDEEGWALTIFLRVSRIKTLDRIGAVARRLFDEHIVSSDTFNTLRRRLWRLSESQIPEGEEHVMIDDVSGLESIDFQELDLEIPSRSGRGERIDWSREQGQ